MIIGEFCECYPPHIDGVGMVVSAYCRELNQTQEACYYIAPRGADKNLPEPDLPYPVIQYAGVPIPKEAYKVGMAAFDLPFRYELSQIPFDIVHAHTPFVSGVEALRVARQRDIPLVATLHSKYYDDFMSKTHSERIASTVVKYIVSFFEKCDEVWTVNDASVEVLRSYGFKGDVVVMPNGTDLWYPTAEDAAAAERRFALGGGDVFLFVGQQNFKKNLGTVLEAAAIYGKTHPDFRLVLAGQGPDEEKLKALAASLGIVEQTVFCGHIADRETLKGLYARADLFLFPSLYDTAGLVVREAAAAGTPSIVIAGSCAADGIRDGDNGFLCGNTPASLAACMERAKPLAKTVGERARETIPVPWSKITETVVSRYAELIGRKKKQVQSE